MLLKSITVANYKSFLEPQTVQISEGFNLFIGANNSGKTSILEALDMNSSYNTLHKSVWSMPNYGDLPRGRSSLKLVVETSIDELRRGTTGPVLVPIPEGYRDRLGPAQHLPLAAYSAISDAPINVSLDFGGGAEIQTVSTEALGESLPIHFGSTPSSLILRLEYPDRDAERPDCQVINFVVNEALRFSNLFRPLLYRFSAQRNSSVQSGFTGIPPQLAPDASNLAYCIASLQNNDAYAHGILCEWVNRVFPAVKWVQAPPIGAGAWRIEGMSRPLEERRLDLVVPLMDMGTGIGNVVAMLYVVLTARHPQVIAMDEPNSFLHPKALRELLQILATEGSQHQLILTGHSPELLTSIVPKQITIFNANAGKTSIRQVHGADIAEIRADVSELGIRMTDLHGRDHILWVEGQTEELVMPALLQKYCPTQAAGIGVLRVEHTSKYDRSGTDVLEVVNTYARLTNSALVPPAVTILIDAEKRSAATCRKLERETKGRLRFLPSAMIENYVLYADAIAEVLREAGEDVDTAAVQHRLDEEELGKHKGDGAKILASLFNDLSEARVEFRKTVHVPQLFSWIIDNAPERLDELGRFLQSLFD